MFLTPRLAVASLPPSMLTSSFDRSRVERSPQALVPYSARRRRIRSSPSRVHRGPGPSSSAVGAAIPHPGTLEVRDPRDAGRGAGARVFFVQALFLAGARLPAAFRGAALPPGPFLIRRVLARFATVFFFFRAVVLRLRFLLVMAGLYIRRRTTGGAGRH